MHMSIIFSTVLIIKIDFSVIIIKILNTNKNNIKHVGIKYMKWYFNSKPRFK